MAEIHTAMAAIMAEVQGIAKNRKNKQQGYNFRGIDDIYEEFHPRLAQYGIITVPEALEMTREERPSKSGGVLIETIVKMRYHAIAKDGSEVCGVAYGEGMDSGDKSCNKAMSGAHKYWFVQTFALPTGENVDSENENPEAGPKDNGHQSDKEHLDEVGDASMAADLIGEIGTIVKASGFTEEQKAVLRAAVKAAKRDLIKLKAIRDGLTPDVPFTDAEHAQKEIF